MKKIDIILFMEIFNIRNQKNYPKVVLTDFCGFVKDILSSSDNYIEFINNFDYRKLSYSGLDYNIMCDFATYLKRCEHFVQRTWR